MTRKVPTEYSSGTHPARSPSESFGGEDFRVSIVPPAMVQKLTNPDDSISRETASITDPEAKRKAKLALIERVRAHPSRERVVPHLMKVLAGEDDPEIIIRLIETLGGIGDSSCLDALVPFLYHQNVDVIQKAMRTLLVLDAEVATPAVEERLRAERTKVRQMAIMELIRSGRPEGMQAVLDFSFSDERRDRKIALACLIDIATETAQPILIRMFRAETDPTLLEQTAALLPLMLREDGITALYETRAQLQIELDEIQKVKGDNSLISHKLSVLADAMDELVRNCHLPPEEITALEERYRIRFEPEPLPKPSQKLVPQPALQLQSTSNLKIRLRRQYLKWKPEIERIHVPMLAFMSIGLLSVLIIVQVLNRRPAEEVEEPRPQGRATGFALRAPGTKITHSALGEVGEPVRFEGEVISLDPERGTLIAMRNRAIGVWVEAPASTPWSSLGRGSQVVIEGKVAKIKDERNVAIKAEVVRLPTEADKYFKE